MASKRKKKAPGFKYIKLKDLSQGKVVNVVGVVSSFVSPKPISDGYTCSVTLIDESKLEVDCCMFHNDRASLPPQLYPGDIVCLKGAATEGLAPQISLKTNISSGWVVFRKNVGYKPLASSMEYRVIAGSQEDARMEELRKWSTVDVGMASPVASSLDQLSGVPGSHKSSSSHLLTPTARGHTPMSNSLTPSARTPPPGTPLAPRTLNSGSSFRSPRIYQSPQAQVSRPATGRYNDVALSAISDLVIDSRDAGVMGVVKYFKPPMKSRGKDCYTVLYIVDNSTTDSTGLTCIIFNPNREMLPVVCACGEVVMLKGLSINTFDGARQAMGHEHTLVGVFPLDIKYPPPDMIENFYVMKTHEKTRLQGLQSWATTRSVPMLINSKMEELSLGSYCSCVCLVLAVLEPRPGNNGVVLMVTDGTTPKHLSSINADELKVVQSSHNLCCMYQLLSCMVKVTTASRPAVNVGDVVQLVNVRMLEKSRPPLLSGVSPGGGRRPESTSEELMVEVVLEDHERYQGAVRVHAPDSKVAQDFRKSLPVPEGPHPISKAVDSRLVVSTKLLYENVRESTLAQVQSPSSAIGSVHEVTVQVVGVGKRVWSCMEEMTQLRCPACLALYLSPQPHMENFSDLVNAGDPCACCGEEGGEGVPLCYMYTFSLLVADATSQLEVAVSGPEGDEFMPQNPVNLYCDSTARDYLLDLLYLLTGGNDPFQHMPLGLCFSQPRPSIKLCIVVIKTCADLRRYKITHTNLQFNKI